jgi:hypothetical protein
LFFIIALASCSSLPIKGFDKETDINEQRIEELALNRNIVDHLEEWDVLRPRIYKLIELEDELSFLIEQVGHFQSNEKIALSFRPTNDQNLVQNLDRTGFSMPNNLENMLTKELGLAPSQLPNPSKEEILTPDSSNIVDVGKAPDIAVKFLKVDGKTISPQTTAVPSIQQPIRGDITDRQILIKESNPRDIVGVSDTKFSGSNESRNRNTKNDCKINRALPVDGIGIHLVSYSTKKGAIKGWEKLLELHKDLLCGKMAAADTVSVNGKKFFSMRVGPIKDDHEAEQLCQSFRQRGQYCKKSVFSGVLL